MDSIGSTKIFNGGRLTPPFQFLAGAEIFERMIDQIHYAKKK